MITTIIRWSLDNRFLVLIFTGLLVASGRFTGAGLLILGPIILNILFFDLYRINGVHQVGVVHHQFGRFLGKFLSLGINHIDKTRICQILNVIHHRGT